jgi:DNA-binding MarR family transcriptional regulator
MPEPYILTTESVKGGAVAETGDRGHHALCLRLMQMFPRITRGMRRSQDRAAPRTILSLGPPHLAALEHLREGPVTVGTLAARLELTLSTVSGVVADLDRAGFVVREADADDRRRTIVRIAPAQAALIEDWLDGAARPLSRVLDRLAPAEREAFLKAMDLLEEELRAQDKC